MFNKCLIIIIILLYYPTVGFREDPCFLLPVAYNFYDLIIILANRLNVTSLDTDIMFPILSRAMHTNTVCDIMYIKTAIFYILTLILL